MPIVEFQPKQGQLKSSVAEQQAVDWSLLVNGESVDGATRIRSGWEIMKAPAHYDSVADPSSPDSQAYQVKDYYNSAEASGVPLGSYLFAGSFGDDYIISVWRAPASIDSTQNLRYRIVTTSGQFVDATVMWPSVNGVPLVNIDGGDYSKVRTDPADKVYHFCRWADTVFFCNGGYLWSWQPYRMMRPNVVDAWHNPQNAGAGIYVTSKIWGASIVAVHQDCLVLSGFEPDTPISLDNTVDPTGSGLAASNNDSALGGFKLVPNSQGVFVNQYTIMCSDPGMVNCFSVTGIYQVPTRAAVSALSSFQNRLLVWSGTEMAQLFGPLFQNSQVSFQLISTGIGCMGKRAHTQTNDGKQLFLGDTNVYSWDGSGIPQIVSSPISSYFREGSQGFWRWAFTAENPDLGPMTGQPINVQTRMSDDACMVWVSSLNYMLVAVTSGNKRESNDLVLGWDPDGNKWWVDATEGATDAWIYAGSPGFEYWQDNPAATLARSAAVGRLTLMVSDNEPSTVWSQTYAYADYAAATRPAWFICVNRGGTDDSYSGFYNAFTGVFDQPYPGRMAFLAISAPVFLGDSNEKLERRFHLRTMGIRNDNYNLSYPTNKLKLYMIPEIGHSDVVDSTDTTSVASEQVITTWRDSQGASAYWQDPFFPAASAGMWSGTGALPVGWQQAWIKRWNPLAPVDRRIDIPARVTQWFRFALSRVVQDVDCSPVVFLSASVQMEGGYGQRRG